MSTSLVHESSLELARRLSVDAVVARVASVTQLAPSFVEVTLDVAHAKRIAGAPGNDVMVRIEESPGVFVRRRYTVRRVIDDEQFVLWVSTAPNGPGARWATSLRTGDEVDVVGPRGKITLDPLADWHLFVGDTTGLAAFYRMAEAIEVPGRAIFVVEVDHPDDAVTSPMPEGLGVTGIFVDRADRALGDATGLSNGLAALVLPNDVGQAYVFGEYNVGRVVRSILLDRGLRDEQIAVKAFWRAGVGNAEHGEPPKS